MSARNPAVKKLYAEYRRNHPNPKEFDRFRQRIARIIKRNRMERRQEEPK